MLKLLWSSAVVGMHGPTLELGGGEAVRLERNVSARARPMPAERLDRTVASVLIDRAKTGTLVALRVAELLEDTVGERATMYGK